MLLQATRFLQKFPGVLPAFPEGLLRGLALDDALLQGPLGGRQIHRAPVQWGVGSVGHLPVG